MSILVSSSSDKTVRIWHTGNLEQPLTQLGLIRAHTRPVEALAFEKCTDTSGILYTADSLGSVKVWDLQRSGGSSGECQITLRDDWQPHRTGINSIFIANGLMLSGSSDETFIIDKVPRKSVNSKILHTVSQPAAVKALLPLFLILPEEDYIVAGAGDSIRIYSYDPSSAEDPPELLREIEAHWHDITSLAVWVRTSNLNQVELWVLSASLDSTLRRWNINETLKSNDNLSTPSQQLPPSFKPENHLTEEEERELAELMDDDL
ncbi:hypothetical protein Clacol_006517 [Clathrus columnatus]|uniref:WD40 repeat-like protein n=1 Tax=Clathrus columnatus TaxID=1419009 RepID=A0AAV5AIH2_9AGAM|nr:hypothetical protein Clacol_006517 [Clathrus columnatus]